MAFFIYKNNGGICAVQEKLTNLTKEDVFDSIEEIFTKIVTEDYKDCVRYEDLSIHYYSYDDRIDKEVFMVVTNRFGDEDYLKKYNCPQFVYYLVEV